MDDKNKKDKNGKRPLPPGNPLGGSGEPQRNGGKPFFSRMGLLYLLIIAVMAFVVMTQVNGAQEREQELATSDFVVAVEEGRVKDAVYHSSTGKIDGSYWTEKDAIGDESKLVKYNSTYIGSDSLAELMASNPSTTYRVDVTSSSMWTNLLLSFIPAILIIGVMIYFINQMQGANNKSMQFGKTKAKQELEDRPKVKFSDVAGIDEAVEELQEIKDFLVSPEKFQKLGAKIPRGALLVGPPGTGKTLLAKAVAGEAGVPFFSISGSDFVEMYVGVGASRVRDLFKQAKEAAPAIIFIDEIDAVGRQRGAGLGGGHDEREQTLNQLLVEMDGFDDHDSVILLAATNRPDILDPALLRPGRFDRQITVDRPDIKGREHILAVHAQGKPLAADVNFEKLAGLTIGFTGADLANLMNEAALLAARRNKTEISMAEVTESMERVIAGPERKSRIISEKEKRITAYHESGHALVGHLLDSSSPVHKISIISRGQALGYTLSMPEEDRYLKTRQEMYDELAMFLGGRVAEEVFCDDITTGASNDLERATKMAREMVTRYGFSDGLGTQVYGSANHQVFLGRDYAENQDYSEATAERIDREVSTIMAMAHDRAKQIVLDNRELIDTMARVLIERETIEGPALLALLDGSWDEYLAHEAENTPPAIDDQELQSNAPDEMPTEEGAQLANEESGQEKNEQVIVSVDEETNVIIDSDGTTHVSSNSGDVTLPPKNE